MNQEQTIVELTATLALAQEYVCSMLCPSIKRTGTEWRHSVLCMQITALLEKVQQKAPSDVDGA